MVLAPAGHRGLSSPMANSKKRTKKLKRGADLSSLYPRAKSYDEIRRESDTIRENRLSVLPKLVPIRIALYLTTAVAAIILTIHWMDGSFTAGWFAPKAAVSSSFAASLICSVIILSFLYLVRSVLRPLDISFPLFLATYMLTAFYVIPLSLRVDFLGIGEPQSTLVYLCLHFALTFALVRLLLSKNIRQRTKIAILSAWFGTGAAIFAYLNLFHQ